MSSNPVLEAVQLQGEYTCVRAHGMKVDAVSNVSLELHQNEILGIAGESGCGKSTLLNILYGYVKSPLTLRHGDVALLVDREKLSMFSLGLEERRKRIWWKHISQIPQNAMNVLNPTMRIKDHFAELFKIHLNVSKEEAYAQAQRYSESMNLPQEALSAFPHQLSGGMKQRVVLAMAMSLKPNVLLADEPSSALDVINQRTVLALLLRLQRATGNSLVVVSHDLNIHSILADRIAIMYAGKIVEAGETAGVFKEPLHPYTRALVESLPELGNKSKKVGINGQPPDLSSPPPGCRFSLRCPKVMDICRREEPTMLNRSEHSVACWLSQEV